MSRKQPSRPLLALLKDQRAWHLEMARKWRSLPPDTVGNNKRHASYHRSEAMNLARTIKKMEA